MGYQRPARGSLGLGTMRAVNRKLVFDEITINGPISRPQLTQTLALSATAIGDLVSELLRLGLIRESGVGESIGGRRPILLEAYSDVVCLLGVEIRADLVQALVSDPGGRILARSKVPVAPKPNPADILRASLDAGRRALQDAKLAPSRRRHLFGVGVACSGIVSNDGMVMLPDVPGWERASVDLRADMEAEFGVVPVLDNDANLGALAEIRFGAARGKRNLVYVLVHAGVGAGLVLDGRVYGGQRNGAGELGHTVVDLNGELCQCGNHGCLETQVSNRALAAYVAEGIRLGRPSRLSIETELDATAIGEAAAAGDRAAVAAVERVGEYLGLAFANVLNLFSPEAIVIAGAVARAGDTLLSPMAAIARQRALVPVRDAVTFEISALGEDGPALGACAAALDARLTSADLSEPDGAVSAHTGGHDDSGGQTLVS